jgi:hypothetical protein
LAAAELVLLYKSQVHVKSVILLALSLLRLLLEPDVLFKWVVIQLSPLMLMAHVLDSEDVLQFSVPTSCNPLLMSTSHCKGICFMQFVLVLVARQLLQCCHRLLILAACASCFQDHSGGQN